MQAESCVKPQFNLGLFERDPCVCINRCRCVEPLAVCARAFVCLGSVCSKQISWYLHLQCLDLHHGLVLGSRLDRTLTGQLAWKVVHLSVSVWAAGPGLLVAGAGLSVPAVPPHRAPVPDFGLVMAIQRASVNCQCFQVSLKAICPSKY